MDRDADLRVDLAVPRLLGESGWSSPDFRHRFLRTLFLHGEFTERYSSARTSGNHFTADAAALVHVGLFFGRGFAPVRWAHQGYRIPQR
jgi:hypothetical protein